MRIENLVLLPSKECFTARKFQGMCEIPTASRTFGYENVVSDMLNFIVAADNVNWFNASKRWAQCFVDSKSQFHKTVTLFEWFCGMLHLNRKPFYWSDVCVGTDVRARKPPYQWAMYKLVAVWSCFMCKVRKSSVGANADKYLFSFTFTSINILHNMFERICTDSNLAENVILIVVKSGCNEPKKAKIPFCSNARACSNGWNFGNCI